MASAANIERRRSTRWNGRDFELGQLESYTGSEVMGVGMRPNALP